MLSLMLSLMLSAIRRLLSDRVPPWAGKVPRDSLGSSGISAGFRRDFVGISSGFRREPERAKGPESGGYRTSKKNRSFSLFFRLLQTENFVDEKRESASELG